MHDGQSLQAGTTHYFGDNFSKAFDISFQDKDGSLKHPYQSSWGVSTRLIGALIMVHGDDNGLVLPPYVAPIQVVIIPIRYDLDANVKKVSDEIYTKLKDQGIRVKLDNDQSRSPGWKYAEYEMKGIPLRIEIGPRDLANDVVTLAYRYNGEKKTIKLDEISSIPQILDNIHLEMYDKAKAFLDGGFTDEIWDYDLHKIDFCVDANYPDELKQSISYLANWREDFFNFRDMGLDI